MCSFLPKSGKTSKTEPRLRFVRLVGGWECSAGDTNMFEHILEAEPINAEKEPYTFPPTFVLPKKDLAHKLPILKAMATFWEIKLNLNGVEVDSA